MFYSNLFHFNCCNNTKKIAMQINPDLLSRWPYRSCAFILELLQSTRSRTWITTRTFDQKIILIRHIGTNQMKVVYLGWRRKYIYISKCIWTKLKTEMVFSFTDKIHLHLTMITSMEKSWTASSTRMKILKVWAVIMIMMTMTNMNLWFQLINEVFWWYVTYN